MKYPPILRRSVQLSHSVPLQFAISRNYSNSTAILTSHTSLPVYSGQRRSLLRFQPQHGYSSPFALLTLARFESTSVPEVKIEDSVLGALDGAFGAPHVHSTLGDDVSRATTGSNVDAPVAEVKVEDGVLGALDGAFGAPHVHSSIGDFRAAADSTAGVFGPKLSLNIPEPPEVSPTIVESVNKLVLNSAGEPTFESLGIGGWTPSGMVQQCMEFLHITVGLPWWGAILAGTIVVRTLVFPLVLKSQRNAAKMRNNLPEMQGIQLKLTQAKQSGDQLMVAKYTHDLMAFMKEKDINPLKSMVVPLAMAPVFISFFFGLRKMANLPVESMREGGLFWFTDLTVMDPYYILPLITSTTLLITLEVGADGVRVDSGPHSQLIKYFTRAIPVIIFPLTMNFPAALLCYWVSTNGISLIQVSLLKIPAIRAKFGIDAVKHYNTEDLPIKKKGFMESAKESWNNVKTSKQLEERERYDEMTFKRAGRGPIPKTFKYDPTKVQAKSK